MAKPGSDGGRLAKFVCDLREGELIPSDPVGAVDDIQPLLEYTKKLQYHHICGGLQSCKYMKAVPAGRARREMWQMMAGNSDEGADLIADYFNHMCYAASVPTRWHHSEAVQLDKQIGKGGTDDIRLICKLCPLGKLFFVQIQAETKDMNYGFGY